MIVRLNALLTLIRLASVTLAVNEEAPATLGVPLKVPSLARFSPVGSVPLATIHESGSVPVGLAVSVCEYIFPVIPPGSGLDVVITGAALTTIEYGWLAVLYKIFGVNVPEDPETVPLKSPVVGFSVRPPGSVPVDVKVLDEHPGAINVMLTT